MRRQLVREERLIVVPHLKNSHVYLGKTYDPGRGVKVPWGLALNLGLNPEMPRYVDEMPEASEAGAAGEAEDSGVHGAGEEAAGEAAGETAPVPEKKKRGRPRKVKPEPAVASEDAGFSGSSESSEPPDPPQE